MIFLMSCDILMSYFLFAWFTCPDFFVFPITIEFSFSTEVVLALSILIPTNPDDRK